jgi:acyl-CoA reductase-like NAD-dependent aldehyde dehydrogenase
MTPEQVELVRTTFRTAVSRLGDLSEVFYAKLFIDYPDLRHLFPQDMSKQKLKMVETLTTMVEHVDNPDVMANLLIPLGRRHSRYGAHAEQLPAIIGTLANVVREANGATWTPQADTAWDQTFESVSSMFLTGLAHAHGDVDTTPQILMLAQSAASDFLHYSQEDVDRICEAVYRAGFDHRIELAQLAVAETGMGRVESKVMKNVLATQMVWQDIKDVRTVGTIRETEQLLEIAKPMGVVLGIIPVTNPTSTTFYKILSSLKSRNSIIIVPASRAKHCTSEAARLAYAAALAAGAPRDCIQWVENPTRALTQDLMGQQDVAIILATGGEGLVKSAYSSGTPAFGVGAGNVPVYVHESADPGYVAEQVIASKLFDYGTICASEQAIVCTEEMRDALLGAFVERGALVLSPPDVARLEAVAIVDERMNPDIVGKPASFIAAKAGIDAPDDVTLLIAPQQVVGPQAPLSQEVLAPIIACYVQQSHLDALATVVELNQYGGVGHTAVIYADDDQVIEQFGSMVTAGRVLVNMGSSSGAVGIYSGLHPSLTLGCGTSGGNITTDNITARDLLNIQRIAKPVNDQPASRISVEDYLDPAFTAGRAERDLLRSRVITRESAPPPQRQMSARPTLPRPAGT